MTTSAIDLGSLAWGADGLVPVVVQEVATGAVRMLGYADREAVEATLATGEVHFRSRSRARLWKKGETSGNVLRLVELAVDCDGDALLARVDPEGPTCHRGTRSCFEGDEERELGRTESRAGEPKLELGWLAGVIAARRGADPAASYTARLLVAGPERAAQKVGEEATEVVIAALAAAADPAKRPALAGETADLLYHLLVALEAAGCDLGDVAAELRRRHAARSTGGGR